MKILVASRNPQGQGKGIQAEAVVATKVLSLETSKDGDGWRAA